MSNKDEIDEILEQFLYRITQFGNWKTELAKQQLLALKKKWEDEARLDELSHIAGDKAYWWGKGDCENMTIDARINQLNGDK